MKLLSQLFSRRDFSDQLEKIFETHAVRATEWYESGRLMMNGRNYAKDIYEGLRYARGLLAEHEPRTPAAAIELLEAHKKTYEGSHDDPEGFGVGTLTELINDLKQL